MSGSNTYCITDDFLGIELVTNIDRVPEGSSLIGAVNENVIHAMKLVLYLGHAINNWVDNGVTEQQFRLRDIELTCQ